jgi:hypothetical protein
VQAANLTIVHHKRQCQVWRIENRMGKADAQVSVVAGTAVHDRNTASKGEEQHAAIPSCTCYTNR